MNIPLSSPDIGDLEKKYVMEVLDSQQLCFGEKQREFERKFAEYVGTKYALSVNSGTSGLHLCLLALGLEPWATIATTPFSFIASANCINFVGAELELVDIDDDTLNMDLTRLDTSLLSAVLPVHVFGLPCKIPKMGISIIEDACEALGAPVGTEGDCAVFAFYPNKQITTGEGGMIVTDDKKIYDLCKSMRNQGREGDSFVRLGYNYRLSDINCAVGLAQLERIEEILVKRRQVANWYKERLKDVDWIIVPEDRKSWFVYVIRVKKDRDALMQKLQTKGVQCKNYFQPIHLTPFYRREFGYKEGDFPVAEKVSKETIALPFFNNLTEKQVDYVCEVLQE